MSRPRSNSISESSVVYFSAGGHVHDGIGSSIIDTSKYSVFDFGFGIVGTNNDRINKQNINQIAFKNFVIKTINESVLEPAGIVLQDDIINSRNIIAGSITSTEIAANTITANNIAAHTITSNQIDVNGVLASSIVLTNGDFWNSNGSFSLGGSNGVTYDGNAVLIGANVIITAELNADSITVGTGGNILEIDDDLQSGTKAGLEIGGGSYNYWYTDGTFRVGGATSFMEWDGTTFKIRGGFDSGEGDTVELEGLVFSSRPLDDPSFSTYGAVVLAPAELSSTGGNDAIRFYYGSPSENSNNTASIRALDGGDLRISGSAASQSVSFGSVNNGVSFTGSAYATAYTSLNEDAYFRNISYGANKPIAPIVGDVHFS